MSYLKNHKYLHTGLKPYDCAICGKSFSQAATLRVHMKIHTGERPYVCPYSNGNDKCQRAFSTSGDLTKHIRVHTQERPYKCPVCGHGFNQNGNLRRHQQKLNHFDTKNVRNAIRVKIVSSIESSTS